MKFGVDRRHETRKGLMRWGERGFKERDVEGIEHTCQQSWKGGTWRKNGSSRALGRDEEEDWTVESAKHFENAKRKSLCMKINGIVS